MEQIGWVFPPISSTELQRWAAYEKVEGPIVSAERQEVSNAIVAMTVAAANGAKDIKVEDFMPRWDETREKESQSPDQIMDLIRSLSGRKESGEDRV